MKEETESNHSEVRSYRDLTVWKLAIDLAVESYTLTRHFPNSEVFGLTTQIRRSAASVPTNIAEGYGREHTGSYVQYLRIAQGSLKELETHVILAERVGLLAASDAEQFLSLADRVGRLIRPLIRSLQRKLEQ